MTAKPETAAEVLAEMKEWEDAGMFPDDIAQLGEWADRLERALSAQGTPIGWGEIDHGRLVSFTASRTERNTAPLYTHPAPARVTVTEEMVERAAVGIHEFRRAYTCRGSLDEQDDGYQARVRGQARAALTSALEAYLPRGCEHSDEFNSAVSKALEADHG